MSAHKPIVLDGRRVNTGRTSSPYSNLFAYCHNPCRLKDDRFSCFKAREKAYEQQWEGLVTLSILSSRKVRISKTFSTSRNTRLDRSQRSRRNWHESWDIILIPWVMYFAGGGVPTLINIFLHRVYPFAVTARRGGGEYVGTRSEIGIPWKGGSISENGFRGKDFSESSPFY